MKIVIAPDSFKESLSALQVAQQIESGFREIFPDAHYLLRPMADGGEGTVDALVAATGGERRSARVTGPLGEPVEACYGIISGGEIAVVEMAAASGLPLVPVDRRNPLKTSSRGTGELIAEALGSGARRLVLGIGGSATNDGGAGMLQALGVRLLDREGEEIRPGGEGLLDLHSIDPGGLDPCLKEVRVEVACDVDNPLTGPTGASAVFGPQKGATPQMVAVLDDALCRFAEAIRRDLGVDVASRPGAGAAGGMGAAAIAFLGARLRPGIEIVMEASALEEALRDADLVISAEGRIDAQTLRGKVPLGVARLAKRHEKPVIALAGSLTPEAAAVHRHGIEAIFASVARPCTIETALEEGAQNVRAAARNIAAAIKVGMALRA